MTNEDKNFSEKDEVILSPTQQIRIKFTNNRLAMIGFYMFVTIVLLVIVTHFYTKFTGYDFAKTDPTLRNNPPSWAHPFGTDKYGRDTYL